MISSNLDVLYALFVLRDGEDLIQLDGTVISKDVMRQRNRTLCSEVKKKVNCESGVGSGCIRQL